MTDRGVVVLGMHRSGTSAATRLISMLGPRIATDPIEPDAANPTGYWESRSLVALNERILEAAGGTWWDPPALPRGWPASEPMRDVRGRAKRAFADAHPSAPWVWKDPRSCLTLPLWRDVLHGTELVPVVVTRDPLEIARSLEKRNAFPTPVSLALWERYTRDLLTNVAGGPALLTSYSSVLDGPAAWLGRAGAFLDDAGVAITEPDPDAVRTFIDPGLRSTSTDFGSSAEGSDEQHALFDLLAGIHGRHERFAVSLPDPTPRASELLAEHRRAVDAHWARPARRRRGGAARGAR